MLPDVVVVVMSGGLHFTAAQVGEPGERFRALTTKNMWFWSVHF